MPAARPAIGPAGQAAASLTGPTGRPVGLATAAELTGLLATLLDALCCAGLPADADVLAQHARAAANRLVSSLHEEGLSERLSNAAPATTASALPEGPTAVLSPPLRWREWTFPTAGSVRAPGLSVDIDGCCAEVGDRRVQLNAVQTRLIAALAAHPGRAVPYGALVCVAWGEDRNQASALYAQMSRLRAALELSEHTCAIRAVSERGYRLEPPRP